MIIIPFPSKLEHILHNISSLSRRNSAIRPFRTFGRSWKYNPTGEPQPKQEGEDGRDGMLSEGASQGEYSYSYPPHTNHHVAVEMAGMV